MRPPADFDPHQRFSAINRLVGDPDLWLIGGDQAAENPLSRASACRLRARFGFRRHRLGRQRGDQLVRPQGLRQDARKTQPVQARKAGRGLSTAGFSPLTIATEPL